MTHKRTWIPQEEKTHEIPDDLLGDEPKKVLLLEDDVAFAEMVREFLEAENYRVTTVSNGAEGLKRLGREQFDAIVCDMVMPGFPGDFFYFAVQKLQPRLAKRFVFMTGHRGDAKIDNFIRNIRGLMLFKPFPLPELMTALKSVIEKSESRR